MLEISLRQLETFAVTAECASFTRAADKLHLTQSTVSAHIPNNDIPFYRPNSVLTVRNSSLISVTIKERTTISPASVVSMACSSLPERIST